MRSIDELYRECRDMGVVNNQKAFSSLFGRKPSWFSSSQARSRVPTVSALVTFYLRLEMIAAATREELDAAEDNDEIEELTGGLKEIEGMRAELWKEIRIRSECNVADRP